ncbi:hypothetical protein JTE90_028907 [Oedothorax gibbosus]|uniref:ditrans,polycis-polyprenyl diphosphate synthase [(2E,6E)-farnesyldiphosphate specific] n=1 Tax=Oedothorax gibbosus TaxID=931172 RepID=A0AAV6UP08_9ARAC|nr:hypothetical protein JTE90_028907 [Oedothorax gibbosus]
MPSHLGLLVCEDQISFSDLSNIIIWSFCVGVQNVSIYDRTGYIKSNGSKLYKEANNRKNSILKKSANSLNIIFRDGKAPYLYNNFVRKNGHKTEDINVYLLSNLDGKQQIVSAAKSLCTDVKRKPHILENFHAQNFDCYLKDIINIPDPELLILFGESNGLMGYLPWHIRLSEIISQPTHYNFSIEEFQDILFRYSKCEQRFGK